MKRSHLFVFGAVLVVLAVLAGWFLLGSGSGTFRGDTSDASILLITVDTLRADRIGTYGYPDVRTPNIDGLAGSGVLFENAITPAVMTLPSHASILTGTYPPAHGIRDNGDYRLAPSALTLTEVLRARGVRTGAVVGAFVLDGMFGLNQGFETYDDTLPNRAPNEAFLAERPASEITDAALGQVKVFGDSRFFMWVHYFDPHQPYAAPSEFSQEYPRNPYDAEIAYVDSEIGRLLEGMKDLGAMEKTLVVLTADHGEGLGDHGEDSHGVFLYEEVTRVPLILSFPTFLPPGRRVAGVVSTVDIMPTILELVSINPLQAAGPVQGTSMWPLIADESNSDPGRAVYTETMVPLLMYGWSPLTAIRDAGYKYIEAPTEELYDLSGDAREKKNISEASRDVASRYRGELKALRDSITPAEPVAEETQLDSDARARLMSLGYAGGGGGAGAVSRADLVDPKDRVQMLSSINRVYTQFGAGRNAAAEREARGILAEDPGNASVRFYLAGALSRQGRFDEAIQELQQLLDRTPGNTEVMANIAWALTNLQRIDEAASVYRQMLDLYPDHTHAEASLAHLEFIKGDYAEAARLYKKLLLRKPNHLSSLLAMAGMYEATGRPREAGVFYQQVTEVDPGNTQAWMNLGWVRFGQRDYEGALEAIQKALTGEPRAPELHIAMGDVLTSMDRLDEAKASYENGLAIAPRAGSGHYGLGVIAMKSSDPTNAVDRFRAALRMRPDKESWREDLARALAATGRHSAAAVELERFLGSGQVPPDRLQELQNRARQYREQGS